MSVTRCNRIVLLNQTSNQLSQLTTGSQKQIIFCHLEKSRVLVSPNAGKTENGKGRVLPSRKVGFYENGRTKSELPVIKPIGPTYGSWKTVIPNL